MNRNLRSLSAAMWTELALAALWGLFGLYAVLFTVTNSGMELAGTLTFAAIVFAILAVFGGGPALLVALVLRSQRRRRSRGPNAAILAFVLALAFLAIGVLQVAAGGVGPFGMTPTMTVMYVYLPTGITALMHGAAGILVLWGRRSLAADVREPRAGPPVHA